MKLKCMIVEDEAPAFDKLKEFILKIPFLEYTAGFENALDAISYLKENNIDVLFLDIQMNFLTGIQMLENLPVKPYTIITSAYPDYALKGYELDVFDYLLKPYSFDRLLSAVNKVSEDIRIRQAVPENAEYIFVRSEYRIENIQIAEILYVEGMQAYLRIVLPGRKIMTKMIFKNILSQLPASQFIQVHKSWVVNLQKIDCVERNRIKIGNQLIPIGETYKESFFKRICPE